MCTLPLYFCVLIFSLALPIPSTGPQSQKDPGLNAVGIAEDPRGWVILYVLQTHLRKKRPFPRSQKVKTLS